MVVTYSPKCWLTFNKLHLISQKTELFITTAVRTNLTFFFLVLHQTNSYPLSIKQRN
jgi:hypothetical protein